MMSLRADPVRLSAPAVPLIVNVSDPEVQELKASVDRLTEEPLTMRASALTLPVSELIGPPTPIWEAAKVAVDVPEANQTLSTLVSDTPEKSMLPTLSS